MKYYKKYADCYFIEGAKRGVICDLSRKKYDFVPLSMIEWIKQIDGVSQSKVDKLKEEYGAESVQQYMDFLFDHEYIFECDEDEISAFKTIELDYKSPSNFISSVFEIESLSNLNWKKVVKQLDQVNCKHVAVYYSGEQLRLSDLDLFLTNFHSSRIRSVEFYAEYSHEFDQLMESGQFCEKHKRLKSLVLSKAPKLIQKTYGMYGMGNITTIPTVTFLTDIRSMVHPYYMNTNIDLFTESQKFNTFFNRKLFVKPDGQIVKSLSDDRVFGHIELTDLKKLSKNKDYQEFWRVDKSHFNDCRICEYRFMCVDNRKPIKNEAGEWGFEKKCNYDPNTMEWVFDE